MTGNSGRGYDHLPDHRRRIYAQDACHDFDQVLQAAAVKPGKVFGLIGWPDDLRPIADEQDAWRLLGKMANCKTGRAYTIRRNQADGLGPVQHDDGTWEALFVVVPKAKAGTT